MGGEVSTPQQPDQELSAGQNETQNPNQDQKKINEEEKQEQNSQRMQQTFQKSMNVTTNLNDKIYLGLKRPKVGEADTSLQYIDEKEIFDRLKDFHEQLIKTQAESFKKSNKDIASNFNKDMPEGYRFILKILLLEYSDGHKEKKQSNLIQIVKLKCWEILNFLFAETDDAIDLFFDQEEVSNLVVCYMRQVGENSENNYKDQAKVFLQFIYALQQLSVKRYEKMYEIIFKKCRFTSLISSILIDSDNLMGNENIKFDDKIDITRSSFKFLNQVTKDNIDMNIEKNNVENQVQAQEKKQNLRDTKIVISILTKIYDQPGLVSNMIFNLYNPEDDDDEVLINIIALIGNMCFHLKKVQQGKIMIETGTFNLITILKSMQETKFKMETSNTIRKATSTREIELLDSFIANGLIEAVTKILDGYGEEQLTKIENTLEADRDNEQKQIRQVQLNLQCIILNLCYRSQNVRQLEKLGALKYISNFDRMKIQLKRNEIIFVNTVLQYCSQNVSIRLEGPTRFFVNKIFNQIEKMKLIQNEEQDFNLCFKSIANLSLLENCHDVIWQVDNLKILLDNMHEFIHNFEESQIQNLKIIQKNIEKYLSCFRIISNCLLSEHILHTFQKYEFQDLTKKLTHVFQHLVDLTIKAPTNFDLGNSSFNIKKEIDQNEEMRIIFKTIENESQMALWLIETDEKALKEKQEKNQNFITQQQQDQIDIIMEILKNHDSQKPDIHILTKALAILRKFHCGNWKKNKSLYKKGILQNITQIMSYGQMATSKECTNLCISILQNLDDMVLWLKFSGDRLTINSACTLNHLVQWGEPHNLPVDRGLYRNWGAFFDFGDVIEIPGGLLCPQTLMEQWTISFWAIFPLQFYDTGKTHVLIQNIHGYGAYVQIDANIEQLQAVCEQTGNVIDAGINLNKLSKGWHNIIVMCDNLHYSGKGRIRFFIDGKEKKKDNEQYCLCYQPIGFIGNSKAGNQPFGTVSDLRIFPYNVNKQKIQILSTYHKDLEFFMPDQYLQKFIENGIIKQIIDEIENYSRKDVKINLCRILYYISTQRDCKAYLLKYNCLQKALNLAQDEEPEIQMEALKLFI